MCRYFGDACEQFYLYNDATREEYAVEEVRAKMNFDGTWFYATTMIYGRVRNGFDRASLQLHSKDSAQAPAARVSTSSQPCIVGNAEKSQLAKPIQQTGVGFSHPSSATKLKIR